MRRLRDPQWYQFPVGLALGVAAVALLAACTGRPSVKSTWSEGNSRNLTFTRLLVVGVSPDYTQRCNFEYWLVRDLRSNKLAADPSCNYMSKDEPLSREGIERLVATLHSDGVLATRMVASDWLTKEGGSRDTRSTGSYKYVASGYDTGFYGVYGVPVDYYQFKTLPSIMNSQGAGHIITKLYETHGAAVVYTIDTKVKDVESGQLGLAMVTPSIADRLRRDRLIQ
jgi:hypothetical protein